MKQEYRKKWMLIPTGLPAVIRRCPKCSRKTEFQNSGKFRVNANGRMLDIWLVYRCRVCETSWNMAVYERIEADALEQVEYEAFLKNDSGLAAAYGSSRKLFARNRAEMGGKSNAFTVQVKDTTIPCRAMEWQEAEVWLGGCLKLRIDALFAKEMGISRNQVKRLCESGQICTFEGNADSGARVKDGQIFYFRRKESVFG